MSHKLYLSMLLLSGLSSHVFGLSMGYEGSALPFTVTYDQTVQSSWAPVLQVVNEAGADVLVLSWQLELEVRALEGTHGELLFHSTVAPPDALFGQEPGPISNLTNPSDKLIAFDGDTTEFDGEPVPAQTARNILELTIMATSEAAGTFQLVMPEFDAEHPDSGASWFEPEGVEPVAFENFHPSAFPGFVLLGSIYVTQSFPAGDYNSDGVVGPLDYDRWREHFGNQVNTAGENADGNRDLTIDAADYIIWRKNVVMGSGSGSANVFETGAPEPASLFLVVMGATCWFRLRERRPRNRCRYVKAAA
jgi:Dockerin type I domain